MKHILIYTSFLISFIILLISYLYFMGIIRWIKIKWLSPKSIFNLKKPKYHKNIKIVITPKNPYTIKSLRCLVNSLLSQTIQIQTIDIILPYDSHYQMESSLADYVKIRYLQSNYDKSLQGVIHSILQEVDNNSIFIHIDDSTLYGKDLVQTCLSHIEENENQILYISKNNITKCLCYQPKHFKQETQLSTMKLNNIEFFLCKNVCFKKLINYEFNFIN